MSRSGGRTRSAVGVKEQNLLGSGTAIEVMFKSDVDRDSHILKYRDRNLGDSWYGLDRQSRRQQRRPLRSTSRLASRFIRSIPGSAQGISVLDRDSIGTFYDRGEIAVGVPARKNRLRALSRAGRRGCRMAGLAAISAGLAYDEHHFSMPLPDSDYTLASICRRIANY